MGGPGGGDGGGGGGGDIDGLDSITSVLTPRNQSMGGKTNRGTLIWRRFRLGAYGGGGCDDGDGLGPQLHQC